MSEPDIEKKRKKRRRSARVYVNANRPLAVPLSEIADYFPPDDDGDDAPTPAHSEARARTRAMMRPDETKRDVSQAERRRLAREGKAVVNPDGHISYPIETVEDLHNAAVLARSGHGDVKAARRLIARRAKELGVANPLKNSAEKAVADTGNPHTTGADFNALRVSPPRAGGQQSPSTGDHGAAFSDPMAQPGPRELAYAHPDLRQSSVDFNTMWSRLRTANGDNQNGDRAITHAPGTAQVALFDAASQSGRFAGMQSVQWPPSHPVDHQSRGSAVPPNGSHGLGQPESRHPMGMKAITPRADALDILRRNARGEL